MADVDLFTYFRIIYKLNYTIYDSQVHLQRGDMARIIRHMGIPTPAPKPRGKSPGRPKRVVLDPRTRLLS